MIPLFLPQGAALACKCGASVTVEQTGQVPHGWRVEPRATAHQLVTALECQCPLCAWPYCWNWGAVPYMNETMQTRKGQPFRELARGAKNTALIEFMDGYQVVTSRNGYRKREIKPVVLS